MRCGLLGRTLSHSYSPIIHGYFGNYDYTLYEKEPEELEAFLCNSDFSGINVTMPYKKSVIPFLDELTKTAKKLNAVNTVIRKADGTLLGHNSDYFGFQYMVQQSGISPAGKKCLVLGSGGAAATAVAVLQELGAAVVVISRKGENHYGNLWLHQDAQIIVNTTPVGMYPHNGVSPVDLTLFPHLEAVFDCIYNPARTQLILDAQKRGIPAIGGLKMLVAQAKESAQFFTGHPICDEEIQRVCSRIYKQTENIILIGMPGCGKTTIAKALSEATGRQAVDSDEELVRLAGKFIERIFAEDGEAVFRKLEHQVLSQLGKCNGLIISTGGGCVTKPENEALLRQNGRIFWLQRSAEKLATEGRPLSQGQDLQQLYALRQPLYAAFADKIICNDHSISDTITQILKHWEELV